MTVLNLTGEYKCSRASCEESATLTSVLVTASLASLEDAGMPPIDVAAIKSSILMQLYRGISAVIRHIPWTYQL